MKASMPPGGHSLGQPRSCRTLRLHPLIPGAQGASVWATERDTRPLEVASGGVSGLRVVLHVCFFVSRRSGGKEVPPGLKAGSSHSVCEKHGAGWGAPVTDGGKQVSGGQFCQRPGAVPGDQGILNLSCRAGGGVGAVWMN